MIDKKEFYDETAKELRQTDLKIADLVGQLRGLKDKRNKLAALEESLRPFLPDPFMTKLKSNILKIYTERNSAQLTKKQLVKSLPRDLPMSNFLIALGSLVEEGSLVKNGTNRYSIKLTGTLKAKILKAVALNPTGIDIGGIQSLINHKNVKSIAAQLSKFVISGKIERQQDGIYVPVKESR